MLAGKGTEDAGAASGTEDDDTPEHVRDAIRLAGDGFDDKQWNPDGFDLGRSSVMLNYFQAFFCVKKIL